MFFTFIYAPKAMFRFIFLNYNIFYGLLQYNKTKEKALKWLNFRAFLKKNLNNITSPAAFS